MAIRPIDMQIMTPRMTDLSVMHQHEKERPVLEQLQMVAHQNKEVERNQKIVRKTSKESAMKNDADAKDKGKNSYTYHPVKRKASEIAKDDESVGGKTFDIKI